VRNNQDRLTAPPASADPPIQQVQQAQQPEESLQFVTPTEFVELPSKGKFYPPGHPLHNVETLEIRHMTAKDEDILTSRSLLKKGIAIDRFLQNVIVERNIRVEDLLIGDKNAIIIASRISGYGARYDASITCPSCVSSVEFSFDLNQCEVADSSVHQQHGIDLTDDNTFIIHLERSNLDVEVRLMTSRDEAALLQLAERRRKKKLPESNLTDQFRRIIVSVNGNDNPNYVESFIQNMPARDSRSLRTTYESIIPNIDMTHDFICSECGFDGEVSVPFGANFFWPK
tara:strand:- start:374 stop:1231 length:858 start_codon:yes stop_codon:yes gene_type:complete